MKTAALLLALAPLETPSNFLVVVADDIGVDRVRAYREHPNPGNTPNIDGLAERGVLFRTAWANPLCSPTRAMLLTGEFALHNGIGSLVNASQGLQPSQTVLPEILPEWTSAVLGKWHLNDDTQDAFHPLLMGFDHHAGSLRNLAINDGDYYRWIKHVDGEPRSANEYATTDTTNDAVAALASMPEPWLLLVTYNAPHIPFHAPPAELHSFNITPGVTNPPLMAKAAIEAMDTELGRVLESVDFEDTVVFFMGDNGTTGSAITLPFPADHGKGTMYEGGVRVPFIVAGAGVSRGASSALISITDVFATLAELAGVPSSAEDSISLVPYLSSPQTPSLRETVYSERFRPNGVLPPQNHQRAIRGERYKLIDDEGVEEFYDLWNDPFELNPLPLAGADYERLKAALP